MTATRTANTANLLSGPQGREYDAVADRIAREQAGRRVLDWGAGHGQVTARLHHRGVDVTAYEYRAAWPAGTARFEHFPEFAFDHSPDPVRLPYAAGSFAAVLSLGVLEHVADPDGSVAEVHRVLEPGGRFYVHKLPNRRSYLEWVARRSGLDHHGSRPDDRLYTCATARALLERHGFDVLEIRRANLLPLTVWPNRPRLTAAVWSLNTAADRVPVLNALATNVDVIAARAR